MRSLILPLVLSACAPGDAALLPVDHAPPTSLSLDISPASLAPGDSVTFTVSGASPNQNVFLGFTAGGTSPDAVCPPVLGGECLDLNGPVNLIFSARADASGTVSRVLPLPPTVPLGTYHLQAAVPLGPGTLAELSPATSMEVTDCTDWYVDADADGFGDDASVVTSCVQPPNTIANGGDCDDANPGANPSAPERCNGFDDDCDNELDEAGDAYFLDLDGDGFGDAGATISACSETTVVIGGVTGTYVAVPGDCDDSSEVVFPGAVEVCNRIDDNCAGGIDEGFAAELYFADVDGDGAGAGPANCAELAAGGIGDDGVYPVYPFGDTRSFEVLCDMDEGWTRLFSHDATASGYFASLEDARSSNLSDPEGTLYSLVADLNAFRDADGSFEFRMVWPGDVFVGSNTWRQTSNPLVEPISGYQPIAIDYDLAGWGGLEPSDSPDVLMDGAVGSSTVAYAIGETAGVGGFLRGPSGLTPAVELWVRNTPGSSTPLLTCDPTGFAPAPDDCDDADSDSNPFGVEICGDGIDQNCDGVDEVCDPCPSGACDPYADVELLFDSRDPRLASVTCPAGKSIAFGWSVQSTDDSDGRACIKDNNKICSTGDQSCTLQPCDSPGDDEALVVVACASDLTPYDAATQMLVQGDAGNNTLTCPPGQVIGLGFAFQATTSNEEAECLSDNQKACIPGETTCVQEVCDTNGNDESFIWALCVNPTSAILDGTVVAQQADVAPSITCPLGETIAAGWTLQMSSDIGGEVDCFRESNAACPVGDDSCEAPSCNTPGNDEGFAYAVCTP